MKRTAFAAAAAVALLSTAACQNMMGEHQQPAAATAQTGAATQTAALTPDMVRAIQTNLNQRGYSVGAVDGIFGQSTQAALEHYQRDQNLAPTGQIDERTLVALGVVNQPGTQYTPTGKRHPQSSSAAHSQKVSASMVRDIQTQLSSRGYDVGPIDGMWGSHTRQALMAFQRDQNMRASGRIDRNTLAALNSGTQTGQVQPRPANPPEQQTGQMPEENQPAAPPPAEQQTMPSGGNQ